MPYSQTQVSASSISTGAAVSGGGASRFLVTDGATKVQTPASLLASTGGTGNGVLSFLDTPTGGSTTSNFLNITGTMPTVLTANGYGIALNITGAGSSALNNAALFVNYLAGYTGASANIAIWGINDNNGSATNPFAGAASIGVFGNSTAAGSGDRVGVLGLNQATTSGRSWGGFFYPLGAATTRIGCAGFAAAGTTFVGGYFGLNSSVPTFTTAALICDNAAQAAPVFVARDNGAAISTATAYAGVVVEDGATLQVGNGVLTSGTLTVGNASQVRSVTHSFDWTNAMITALGAVGAGDLAVCTLPAKTIVLNAYVILLTPDSSANALTVALGRVGASYIDYIVASDAKAGSNIVYGDVSGERGTNLTGYDLPSYTATTVVNLHFIKTSTLLNTVTGCTGRVIIQTALVP